MLVFRPPSDESVAKHQAPATLPVLSEKQETLGITEVPEPEGLTTERTGELEDGMSRKAQLSAYFIIAAAAFGLISDGCE